MISMDGEPRFEIVKTDEGDYRWRVVEADGTIAKFGAGGVVGLPHDPEADERSRRAVQEVLRREYEARFRPGA
jgi:hypothetical protein